jgi:hypothetical protein
VIHAITLKQPWAWAVIHGGKDIENRGVGVAGRLRNLRGKRLAIHAGRTYDPDDFDACKSILRGIGPPPPSPEELYFGGIIGAVTIGSVVEKSRSPWFSGPFGIVFLEPEPLEFMEVRGWPGVFKPPELQK